MLVVQALLHAALFALIAPTSSFTATFASSHSTQRGALPRIACLLADASELHAYGASRSSRRSSGLTAAESEPLVYFVMGGPGSGKGTQCEKLVSRYGMVHLSAGDLLRAEVASGSELGQEISAVIDQGKIVQSETTVELLRAGMKGKPGPFLIDGFPRSIANLEAFEAEIGSAAFMLFLQVSEEEMEARLLKRGESSGRSDDNHETILKRFRTFVEDSMPVVDNLEGRDLLRKVDAGAEQSVVFDRVCAAFADQGLEALAPAA